MHSPASATEAAAFYYVSRVIAKTWQGLRLLLAAGAALAGDLTEVRAQSSLDGFNPNANNTVSVVVVQPDGKVLIGGDFTSLTPNGGPTVTRNRIARLNPDGTLDSTFNPNAEGAVYAIAVQADGQILVGGDFTTIGGQARNHIARLDAVTGAPDAFDPNTNGRVNSIAVLPNGKVLASGGFTAVSPNGGAAVTRNRIARFESNGTLDLTFNPNADAFVNTITVQPDGRVLAGGAFSNIGGQPRNHIARLDPTTGLADSFNPDANNTVLCLAVRADGSILAGGFFTSIGGQTRNHLARLHPTTGLADSFDANANFVVYALAVQADGQILVGGDFTNIGGQPRNRLARLNPATGAADPFNPNANNTVFSIAVQADAKILAGGTFTILVLPGGANLRNRIARLETDGRADRTFDAGMNGHIGDFVYATSVQPDGKILIGGNFTRVLGITRNCIARLHSDGRHDTAFDPNANSAVNCIAVQADGKILVGGDFTTIAGETRNFIARLDPTTGLPDSFNPDADGPVHSIAPQADGKILVGGDFGTIGGQMRNGIARLDPTTGLADSFNPNASGAGSRVNSITEQADGKILVGGSFNTIGGQMRNGIARLDPTTGLADSFNPGTVGEVVSIAVQADGKILVGGGFPTMGGQPRIRIARLDPTTGLADSFNPGTSGNVRSIAVQADGKILVGGFFPTLGGQPRNHIARLDPVTGLADAFNPDADGALYSIGLQPDGKILVGGEFFHIGEATRANSARLTNDTAQQDLTVTPTSVTWTRSGTSPLLQRVTFESSTDNVNYTPLGQSTASGGIWTLTGLNLPTQQELYLRARGYYRGGYRNGSESITESVRNVYLPPPLEIVSITRLVNGHVLLQCLGVPNQVNKLRVSADLSPGSFTLVSPPPPAAEATGVFQYEDAGAVGQTKRFYHLTFP